MAGEPEPNWPRQALRGLVREWAAYARATVAVPVAPVRTMLNAIAIITIADAIVGAVLHRGDGLPAWIDLFRPAIRMFNAAVMASLLHLPLRLLGSRRRWRTSLGAAPFVGAAPMVPLYIVAGALVPATPARGTPAPLLRR